MNEHPRPMCFNLEDAFKSFEELVKMQILIQ
jgi:hypothetical protein